MVSVWYMGRGAWWKLATLSPDNAIECAVDVLNKRGFARPYVLLEHTLVSIFHVFYMEVYNMLNCMLILEPCSLCAPQYLGGGEGGYSGKIVLGFSQTVITLTIHLQMLVLLKHACMRSKCSQLV